MKRYKVKLLQLLAETYNINWIAPDIDQEDIGIEITIDNQGRTIEEVPSGKLTPISDEMWSQFSWVQDFNDVIKHALSVGKSENQILKLINSFKPGATIEAPIVIRGYGDYEVATGNHRLMICKLLGIRPLVWLV